VFVVQSTFIPQPKSQLTELPVPVVSVHSLLQLAQVVYAGWSHHILRAPVFEHFPFEAAGAFT
jgi:hypothetical protein